LGEWRRLVAILVAGIVGFGSYAVTPAGAVKRIYTLAGNGGFMISSGFSDAPDGSFPTDFGCAR
jgi:hypothetical protein